MRKILFFLLRCVNSFTTKYIIIGLSSEYYHVGTSRQRDKNAAPLCGCTEHRLVGCHRHKEKSHKKDQTDDALSKASSL